MSSDFAWLQNVHASVEKRMTRLGTLASIADVSAVVTQRDVARLGENSTRLFREYDPVQWGG
jgi:hypothetical protein